MTKRFLLSNFACIALSGLAFSVSGCGYSLQRTMNPLSEKFGIQKIYVAPLQNDSYKPGVENLVYNELVRTLAADRRIQVVNSVGDSDAILSGEVKNAGFLRGGSTTAGGLFPSKDKFPWVAAPPKDLITSTSYSATLTCNFKLALTIPIGKKSGTVWAGGFGRTHPFPGNNQIGNFGTTSSIINESEFDRALSDMARSMMMDVSESIFAQF